MMSRVTVTISDDPQSLGGESTQSDLEQYAKNLQAYLNNEFDLDITVELGSRFHSTATHSGVEERVREIEDNGFWYDDTDTV